MATSGLGTVYGENKALDALLGSASPATVYLCFYSAAPTKDGGGTEITNIPRKAVTNNATNFPAASGGVKKLHVAHTTDPATGTCAQATHGGFHAHASSDQLIGWGPLAQPFTAGTGDTVTVAIDGISITLSNQA